MTRAAALLVLVTACAGDADTRPPTLAYLIPAIFRPSCATGRCHDEQTASGGLVLDDDADAIRDRLVDTTQVSAGHPENSPLINRLRGTFGSPMPPDYPLPEADIQLIERWIAEGLK